jgi:hypothetical protein
MQFRKFFDGERVRLLPDMRAIKSRHDDIYTVVRAMPEEGPINRYRIKHDSDPFERVVNELQIASISSVETEMEGV